MAKEKILALMLFILTLAACTPGKSPVKGPSEQQPALPGTQENPSVKAGWEEQWNHVLAVAKKEGKVVVYTTAGTEVRTSLQPAFQEKYGISADFIMGKGAEISQKLISERKANINLADVYIGGTTTQVTQLQPAGVSLPVDEALILPEVKDPKAWWGGSLLWVDSKHMALAFNAYPIPAYAINTTIVKPEELKSYRDLLNPKWKGKITLNDPTTAGIGEKGMSFVLQAMGVDFLKDLAKQEPVIIRDQRLQVEWLAHGKYPLAMFCKSDPIAEFLKAGAPIKELIPIEGQALTSGSGNLSLIDGAPHPNAARLFINWLLSREGQTLFSKASLVQSAREDIPTAFLDPVKMRALGVKYMWAETEELLLKLGNEERLIFKEIFSPLIK